MFYVVVRPKGLPEAIGVELLETAVAIVSAVE